MRKTIPRFGNGILADSFSQVSSNKINLHGIFTVIWAWAYPCQRSCIVAITLFGGPWIDSTLHVSLRKRRSKDDYKVNVLASLTPQIQRGMHSSTACIPIQFGLKQPGDHEIVCQFEESKRTLRIPFDVRTRPWPVFTEEEKQFVESNPGVIDNMRANISCRECSHAYIFEESIADDSRRVGGVLKFPDTGTFECTDCGQTLNLRDIQGQVRATLKGIIEEEIRKRR